MQKKNRGVIQKKYKKLTTSRQPKKLIFGIPPYLTKLNEICKNNNYWGAIQKKLIKWGAIKKTKKLGCHPKKNKKNDNLTRNKQTLNKKLPEGFLFSYNQSTNINLIGCDTIVNSPSSYYDGRGKQEIGSMLDILPSETSDREDMDENFFGDNKEG
jgi:hypothetical protein